MQEFDFMKILSWSAIVILSISYWFQIWKIHVHKEVRDLSLTYHYMLALGFGILTYTAWVEDSVIFMVKQVATTIPVMIIIAQIYYHKDDPWHDEDDDFCNKCSAELECHWNACPYCGTMRPPGPRNCTEIKEEA